MQFFVLCGQELDEKTARQYANTQHDEVVLEFPEANHGPEWVRARVTTLVRLFKHGQGRVTIMTRYEHALNQLGQEINEGHLSADNVKVLLFRDDKPPEEHHFNNEGVMNDGWPIGVLW